MLRLRAAASGGTACPYCAGYTLDLLSRLYLWRERSLMAIITVATSLLLLSFWWCDFNTSILLWTCWCEISTSCISVMVWCIFCSCSPYLWFLLELDSSLLPCLTASGAKSMGVPSLPPSSGVGGRVPRFSSGSTFTSTVEGILIATTISDQCQDIQP